MVVTLPERDRQARGLLQGQQPARALGQANTRVIVIASGKGGVGKTNVAVNLGIILSKRGRRVLVFDADLGLANVDVLLGMRVERNLRDVVTGRCDLHEIVTNGPGGIHVAPGGCGLAELVNLDGFSRGRLLRQLADIEGAFDLILIDAAAGVGEDVIQFLRSVGEVMLVTTPEPTALTDAYALIKITTNGASDVKFAVVVNSARNETEGLNAAARLKKVCEQFLQVDVPCWGVLPFCEQVPAAVRRQSPVVVAYPEAEFTRALERLSRRLMEPGGEIVAMLRNGLSQALQGFFQRFGARHVASAG